MRITLPPADTRPIPVRVAAAIRDAINTGMLHPGEKVDSTRTLARQLSVSRGSIVTAFDQLVAEGYLKPAQGSGTIVNPHLTPTPTEPVTTTVHTATNPDIIRLSPGLPDTDGLVTPAWRAAWRDAANHPPLTAPLAGLRQLREEVAAHLRHMRGLVVDPGRIIITSGAREGLTLLLRSIGAGLEVGVESPGYPSLRRIPPELGHRLVDVAADTDGVTVPGQRLDALVVTPSHQYPYGGSLPAARRTALVSWARDCDALLIEDDFDSELRYIGQPLPALAALEPERTVLLGTFSSVISPTIGCGFIVVPATLVAALERTRQLTGQPVSAITQQALANFLASGQLRRHTGRMRRAYKRRRDIVIEALGPGLLPIAGGLHAVLLCGRPVDEVCASTLRRGVEVTALSDYWGGQAAENGLVLGFGHLKDDTLMTALKVLREETY